MVMSLHKDFYGFERVEISFLYSNFTLELMTFFLLSIVNIFLLATHTASDGYFFVADFYF
jgi:hypothetical protein